MMVATMKHAASGLLLLGTVSIGVVANAQNVDTSEWDCEYCPFEEGYSANYEIGATSVSDDSAYFGDATGYDKEGVYGNLDGEGRYAKVGHRLRWTIEDLALDSRSVALEGERQGSYDYSIAYRELPRRQFDTTSTVFVGSGGGALALPSGWVRGTTTSEFTALGTSLNKQNVDSDRKIFELGGRYLPSMRWSVSADYRRQEQDGVKMLGGSYFTNAAILPAPIDYVTDEVDLGVRYAGDGWFLALAWYLSDFENGQTGFGWEHPFTTAAGAEFAALSQPPDSQFSQLSLSGSYAFPVYSAIASFSAAIGEIEQNEMFLPYTTNSNLATAALPRSNLDGSVDTTKYAFSVSAKPIPKSRIRLSYRYDKRDNSTSQASWDRVIADSFISGDPETNIPYSFERSTLSVSGYYDLLDTLRVSAGYDRREIDRDFQEVAEQTEDGGWGRLRWRPLTVIEVEVTGGASKRDVDRYDESVAASLGQNPLLRKYNLAYRYREFADASVTYMPEQAPISVTVSALYADDSYTQSQLGITDGDELHWNADLSWAISDDTSLYLMAGMEDIESNQLGSAGFSTADWRANHDDDFTSFGIGLRARQIADKLSLRFDYTHTDGDSEITVNPDGGAASVFPELSTELDYLSLGLEYQRSEQLRIDLDLRYQRFKAEDWALEAVGPATIPTVLSLGAEPYSPEVLSVGIGFRYTLGERAAAGN